MTVIKAFHNSGEWNQPAQLIEHNVRRMRRGGRSFGTRTEVTTAAHHDALHQHDGWKVWHPKSSFTGGYVDCAVEWDSRVWGVADVELLTLNEERLHTSRGFELPPSTMPVVTLRHLETGRNVVVGAFHLQLANTSRRRAAWHTEMDAIRRFSIDTREQHPGWEQMFSGDGNRNQRITALRDAVDREVRGTKLRNGWSRGLPARGGTHGPRSILDLALTTMPARSFLLQDDGSSDHRPFQTDMVL